MSSFKSQYRISLGLESVAQTNLQFTKLELPSHMQELRVLELITPSHNGDFQLGKQCIPIMLPKFVLNNRVPLDFKPLILSVK